MEYDYNVYFGGKAPEITGSHDLVAEPKFADAAAHNFHLAPDSPALRSGNSAIMVPFDYAGLPRPAAGPVARGALQD